MAPQECPHQKNFLGWGHLKEGNQFFQIVDHQLDGICAFKNLAVYASGQTCPPLIVKNDEIPFASQCFGRKQGSVIATWTTVHHDQNWISSLAIGFHMEQSAVDAQLG